LKSLCYDARSEKHQIMLLTRIFNGYRIFPGGKAAGAWLDHPPLSGTKFNERV